MRHRSVMSQFSRSDDLTVPPLVGCCLWNPVPLSMSLLGFGMGTMLANFHMCGIMLVLTACSFQHAREECESKRAYVF